MNMIRYAIDKIDLDTLSLSILPDMVENRRPDVRGKKGIPVFGGPNQVDENICVWHMLAFIDRDAWMGEEWKNGYKYFWAVCHNFGASS
jgi:hypothetical protein